MIFPTAAVRRLFRIVNGGTPTSEVDNWDGDVAWATPIDLADVHGGRIHRTQRTLTKRGLLQGSASVPQGSILVSTRAPIGYVAETTVPMAFNQGCRGLVPVTPMDTRYFRYQFIAFHQELTALGQGSTFTELSSSALAEVFLLSPSVETQRAIADFLDAETARIDALIAKKRDLIGALRRRVDAVRDRFTVPRGLGGVADLDSDEWPVTALKRTATFFTDGDWIESPYITDEGIRLIQTGNIGRGAFKDQGFRYISVETFHDLHCTEVSPGDVLISRLAGTLGQACIAPDLGTRMIAAVDVAILRPNRFINPEFLVEYLSSSAHLGQAELQARGTTMLRLSRAQLGEMAVPIPPPDVQREVESQVRRELGAIGEVLERLTAQVNVLEERRQALITAAVTGELEVPGVAA